MFSKIDVSFVEEIKLLLEYYFYSIFPNQIKDASNSHLILSSTRWLLFQNEDFLASLLNAILFADDTSLKFFVYNSFARLPYGIRFCILNGMRIIGSATGNFHQVCDINPTDVNDVTQRWERGSLSPISIFDILAKSIVDDTVDRDMARQQLSLTLSKCGYDAANNFQKISSRQRFDLNELNLLEISSIFTLSSNCILITCKPSSKFKSRIYKVQLRSQHQSFKFPSIYSSDHEFCKFPTSGNTILSWQHVGQLDDLLLVESKNLVSPNVLLIGDNVSSVNGDCIRVDKVRCDLFSTFLLLHFMSYTYRQVISTDIYTSDKQLETLSIMILVEGSHYKTAVSNQDMTDTGCHNDFNIFDDVSEFGDENPIDSSTSPAQQNSTEDGNSNSTDNKYRSLPANMPVKTRYYMIHGVISSFQAGVLNSQYRLVPVIQSIVACESIINHDQQPIACLSISLHQVVIYGTNSLLGLVSCPFIALDSNTYEYTNVVPFMIDELNVIDHSHPHVLKAFKTHRTNQSSHPIDSNITSVHYTPLRSNFSINGFGRNSYYLRICSGDDQGRLCLWDLDLLTLDIYLVTEPYLNLNQRIEKLVLSPVGDSIAVSYFDRLYIIGINETIDYSVESINPNDLTSRLRNNSLYIRCILDIIHGYRAIYHVDFLCDQNTCSYMLNSKTTVASIRIWRIMNGVKLVASGINQDTISQATSTLDDVTSNKSGLTSPRNSTTINSDFDTNGINSSLNCSERPLNISTVVNGICITTWIHSLPVHTHKYLDLNNDVVNNKSSNEKLDTVDNLNTSAAMISFNIPESVTNLTTFSSEIIQCGVCENSERESTPVNADLSGSHWLKTLDYFPVSENSKSEEVMASTYNANNELSNQNSSIISSGDAFNDSHRYTSEMSDACQLISRQLLFKGCRDLTQEENSKVIVSAAHSDVYKLFFDSKNHDGLYCILEEPVRSTVTKCMSLYESSPAPRELALDRLGSSCITATSSIQQSATSMIRSDSVISNVLFPPKLHITVGPIRICEPSTARTDYTSLMRELFVHDRSDSFLEVKVFLSVYFASFITPSIGIISAALDIEASQLMHFIESTPLVSLFNYYTCNDSNFTGRYISNLETLSSPPNSSSNGNRYPVSVTSELTLQSYLQNESDTIKTWLTGRQRASGEFWVNPCIGHNYLSALHLRYLGNKSVAVECTWQDYLKCHGAAHLRHCSRKLRDLTVNIRKLDETVSCHSVLKINSCN